MALPASGESAATKLLTHGGKLLVLLFVFIYCVLFWLFMLIGSCWIQVCKIVQGQRYSKRLNERQITALLKVTCQRPQERERDIMQVCSLLSFVVLYFCQI